MRPGEQVDAPLEGPEHHDEPERHDDHDQDADGQDPGHDARAKVLAERVEALPQEREAGQRGHGPGPERKAERSRDLQQLEERGGEDEAAAGDGGCSSQARIGRVHDRIDLARPLVSSRASTTTKPVTMYARTAPYPKSVCSKVVLNV